jgi:hypothetical protein
MFSIKSEKTDSPTLSEECRTYPITETESKNKGMKDIIAKNEMAPAIREQLSL